MIGRGSLLEDRPRMMALIFGIRLMNFGLVFSLVPCTTIFFPHLVPTQVTALLGLFAYFLMMIAVLLIVIRSSKVIYRGLILSPLLVFAAPTWELQLTLLCFTILLCLEGFRRQSAEVGRAVAFATAQLLWAVGGGGLPFLAAENLPLGFGILGALVAFSCALGFWTWQKDLKTCLESLDIDVRDD